MRQLGCVYSQHFIGHCPHCLSNSDDDNGKKKKKKEEEGGGGGGKREEEEEEEEELPLYELCLILIVMSSC